MSAMSLARKDPDRKRKIVRFLKKLHQGLRRTFNGTEFVVHNNPSEIIIAWFNGVIFSQVTRLLDGIENRWNVQSSLMAIIPSARNRSCNSPILDYNKFSQKNNPHRIQQQGYLPDYLVKSSI